MLQNRADAAVREQATLAAGNIQQNYRDNLASISRTGLDAVPLSNSSILAAFPGERGQSMVADLGRAHLLYAATQQSGLTSPQEDMARLATFNPAGEGYAQQAATHDAFQQALQQKYAALAKDPAGYVVGASPEIKSLADAAVQDPTKMAPYAASLDAAYDRLGVPSYTRPLLPKATAQSLASNIMNAPPEQRAQAVEQMAGQYGDLFPRVMGSMVSDGGLPTPYGVLAAISGSANRAALADGIGVGNKPLRDAINPDDAKLIDRQLSTDSNMATLRRSMAYASGGSATFAGIEGAVRTMAYSLAARMDPAAAARQAVASVTSDKYDFLGDARVPVGQGDVVGSAADAALSGLTADNLAVPANPSKSPLTDQQLQGIALSAAQRGRWVTGEHDNSLVRLDVNGQPVMLSNGNRLEVPFPKVNASAPAAPSMVQKIMGMLGGMVPQQ